MAVKIDSFSGAVSVQTSAGTTPVKQADLPLVLANDPVVCVGSGASCRLSVDNAPPASGTEPAVQITHDGQKVTVTPCGAGVYSLSARYYYGGSYRYNMVPVPLPPANPVVGIRG